MKPTRFRRIRRRNTGAKTEGAFFKKESSESFFGGGPQDSFFQPSVSTLPAQTVQRKCADCEKEDKVQREPEKKEEEKKLQRAPEKKEEDKKLMRAPDKKEEEKKLQREPVKKEEDKKLQREPEKKEEDKKIQREPEKKEEDKKIQKKENTGSASSGKSVSNYVSTLTGKGQSLSPQANHFFSARMGYDFSNVKVHTDKDAAESAKDINAKAYTTGNNIVFNEGHYNTTSGEGRRLLAHELTHIVQQNPSIRRQPVDAGVPPPAALQQSPLEQELEGLWYTKGKDAFFQRLRAIKPGEFNDTDTFLFIINNLKGDEAWLATNLLSWGRESGWPFVSRVELELKSLPQSRGYAGLSALIKSADPSQRKETMKFMLPKIKAGLTKKELALFLKDLDITKLISSTDENDRKWMLADDEVMKFLKQELSAPDFTKVVTTLIDISTVPPGTLRDAVIDLLYGVDDIDRNTAKDIINGRIIIYYMEDLKHPANEQQILANNKMDPAVYTAYIRPDGSGQVGIIQKNFNGFNIRGTNMILGKKSLTVEKWKNLLVHEINHALNVSTATPLINYQTEFRAYWVADFRHVADLDDRARQVKAHILKVYVAIKESYDADANVKKAIDAYTRPDGNITNF